MLVSEITKESWIRYTFDPTSCTNKKGTEDILRDVACILIDDGVLYTSSLDSGRNNLLVLIQFKVMAHYD